MQYIVEKRILNNYLVKVEANTPEEAVRKAEANDHQPSELYSGHDDGVPFDPSTWSVYNGNACVDTVKEISVNRAELADLD